MPAPLIQMISHEEFMEFLKATPEKEVNMDQNYSDSSCGCLMVQYGRTHTQFPLKFWCGVADFFDSKDKRIAQLEPKTNALICECLRTNVTTFQQAIDIEKTLK